MPTLVRFLVICLLITGAVYASMLALVTFVNPVERDVTIRLPADRLDPDRHAPQTPGSPAQTPRSPAETPG